MATPMPCCSIGQYINYLHQQMTQTASALIASDFGSACFSSDRFGSDRFGSDRFDSDRSGSNSLGSDRTAIAVKQSKRSLESLEILLSRQFKRLP